MKRILLLGLFFITTPLTLLTAILFLLVLLHEGAPIGNRPALLSLSPPVAFAALPPGGAKFDEEITPTQALEETLRQFFQRYDSPLIDHTVFIIETSEKYNLDPRLIPAIAMQETNLCNKSKEGSHNCWGYNVTGKNYKFFDNYEQAIETVTKTLAEHYRDKHGLVTPEEIEKMYTPSSEGSWAASVRFFMDRL
ncbi:MAG: glucosaminidase domain-containing protein [Candidatus Levybacteria bacterium]|nr:glucosaminidase domain-containing protein [Candidatus Levybacteria bacterium]